MTATGKAAPAWHTRAEELARWAMLRWVNRTDRCGAYFFEPEAGEVVEYTAPKEGARSGFLTHAKLVRHFRASETRHVVGVHTLGPDSHGKHVTIDLDNHDDDPETAEKNEAFALHAHSLAADWGFRPLLWDSDGKGGFRVSVLFADAVPGPTLERLGLWLAHDHAEFKIPMPEVFPKQDTIDPGKWGSWLRLPGRHHKRDVWPRVWVAGAWVDGEAAVEFLLSLTGDSADLIPFDELTSEAEVEPPRVEPTEHPEKGDPNWLEPFQDFNRRTTAADVTDLLERHGWAQHGKRDKDGCGAFTRPDKDPKAGQSGNLKIVNGLPIFFNFSTEANLPAWKGLDPVGLLARLEYGGDFSKCNAGLRERGFGSRVKMTTGGAGGQGGEGGGKPGGKPADGTPLTGAQIILAHFRESYRPIFRRGNSVCCDDGSEIPMGVACAVPDSDLIAKLQNATDAPRFAAENGKSGGVKTGALPRFFSTWAKVAWGDLRKSLPDEDTAELSADAPAGEEFRRLVRDALLGQLVLGETIEQKHQPKDGQSVTQVERRSLIDWCYKFAKPGPWRSIRSYRIWCKSLDLGGGEIKLGVALRHELFAQVKADRRLVEMTANTFTRRAARYGIGQTSREERPHGFSAVVLDPAFVKELTSSLPDDEQGRGTG